jgi:hypothetical protein
MIDMVFAPVDPAIKKKIIESYLAGKGRNQLTRELNEQGIKVSHGSVSNFINAYRKKHNQPLQQESSDKSKGINSSTNTYIVIPRDGGPLLQLLCQDESTDEEEVIPPVTSYSNLPSSVPSIVSMSLYPNTNIPNFNPYFKPYQNNINPQISKPETQELKP